MLSNALASNVVHAIQLAIAPVFLLTGVAALLSVMATRLARIVDRARALDQFWPDLSEQRRADAKLEIRYLERRRHLASWSINFCTSAALLVCIVIGALFIEELFATDLRWLAGMLFIAAMLALICGLSTFLRGVYLATHTGHIDTRNFGK